ncbi:MAG: hypothetical protein KDI82_07875 [Gammaproteobacteria bacterium]|nr:hypothetical protein [Gammaproteobacteria bacterium]
MMGDEIKQTDIARVLPPNPSRGAGQRKRPRRPPQNPDERVPRKREDDQSSHQIDEYV